MLTEQMRVFDWNLIRPDPGPLAWPVRLIKPMETISTLPYPDKNTVHTHILPTSGPDNVKIMLLIMCASSSVFLSSLNTPERQWCCFTDQIPLFPFATVSSLRRLYWHINKRTQWCLDCQVANTRLSVTKGYLNDLFIYSVPSMSCRSNPMLRLGLIVKAMNWSGSTTLHGFLW
jgi:hypothetical protein